MKSYELRYHIDVRSDVRNAKTWYKRQAIGLEKRFALAVKQGIDRIAQQPQLYQKKYHEIRVLHTEVFPFGIYFYWDASTTITILGIFHHSRNPQALLDRL